MLRKPALQSLACHINKHQISDNHQIVLHSITVENIVKHNVSIRTVGNHGVPYFSSGKYFGKILFGTTIRLSYRQALTVLNFKTSSKRNLQAVTNCFNHDM